MESGQDFIWQRHVNPENSKRLSFVIVLLIALFVPVSVFLSSQEQDTRQQAQELPIDQGVVFVETVSNPKVGSIPGELVVEFKSASEAAVTQVASPEAQIEKAHDATIQEQRVEDTNVQTVIVPVGQENTVITDLENNPNVESVEQDSYASILEIPNDPKFPQQYGFNNTGQKIQTTNNKIVTGKSGADASMPDAWNVTTGRSDLVVAILDTGIDDTHPDLKGKVIKHIKISDSNTAKDVHGHGTHVAGVVAADTNNDLGVAGVCPKCKLINVKVMGDNGQGKTSWITAGIDAAVAEGADVINVSAGTFDDSPSLRAAVNNAINSGITVIAASGNCGAGGDKCPSKNPLMYPAAYDEVISVTATDYNDQKPEYAEYGNTVDVAAPGDAIISTFKDSKYAVMNGTSMATPMVSGLAALLYDTSFGNSVENIRNRIQSTADKISGTGTNWQYGRINAAKALGASGSQAAPTTVPKTNNDPLSNAVPTRTPTKSTTFQGTPTPDALSGNMLITAFVNGIGKSIPGANPNPIHKSRVFTADVTDDATGETKKVTAQLQFDPAVGGFTGSLPLKNFISGQYTIAIRTDSTLFADFPDVVTLAQPNSVSLPSITLDVGDINGDNVIDIRDFNLLAVCYSVLSPAKKECTAAIKVASDLNDDGKVNELDYNLFIRNLNTEETAEDEQ